MDVAFNGNERHAALGGAGRAAHLPPELCPPDSLWAVDKLIPRAAPNLSVPSVYHFLVVWALDEVTWG